MNIDHFMYAGPDLDRLCRELQALTGIEPMPGGQHPQLGTHNRLAGSDARLYLELIGPDRSTPQDSPMRASIEALPRPRLHRFIMDATGRTSARVSPPTTFIEAGERAATVVLVVAVEPPPPAKKVKGRASRAVRGPH